MTKCGVSYFGNRFLSHARRDLSRIADSCDYVVHTVSEADLTYHKAVMAKLFSETRKAGLEVWADPWGLGGVFGGESFSKFLLEHRDAWQIMSDGRAVPSACLNRPEWRSYIMEWILTVRDMGAQVIFWDEPHIAFTMASELEGIFSCICPICQDLFRKKNGSTLPKHLTDAVRQFRLDSLRNFLNDVMAYAKRHMLKNALCLYAFKGIAEYDKIWEEASALTDLDIFGCDPYWRWRGRQAPDVHVGEFARHVVSSATRNNKQSQVWIQAMRLPAGAEPEIDKACDAAVRAGITHIAAWSFDGGELLDPVLSENPEQACCREFL
jgi:hypothetical protein